jgi:phosphate transport system substrate-binding protein
MSSPKNETLPLFVVLLIALVIIGGSFWLFPRNSGFNNADVGNPQPENELTTTNSFQAPKTVPAGTAIAINGSTSMVEVNQVLKTGFERKFPGTKVITDDRGSSTGIKLLQAKDIDLAAISRPLTEAEINSGLVAVPIVRDAIAIVVSRDNPFKQGLSDLQVSQIFQGEIVDWSEVGGKTDMIKVIDRPNISGTRQVFQQEVLQGKDFGSGNNFITIDRDATTSILQVLGTNGIGYATYAGVADRNTIRTLEIDGFIPEAENYPYQRTLYYVYQEPPTPEVRAFLGYALSLEGKSEIVEKRVGISF